jgi:hypothetical protein
MDAPVIELSHVIEGRLAVRPRGFGFPETDARPSGVSAHPLGDSDATFIVAMPGRPAGQIGNGAMSADPPLRPNP